MRPLALGLTLLAVSTLPLSGQQTIGVSTEYLGYSFDDGLGASAAQLLMIPVAIRLPLNALTLDIYSAWAQGRVERDDVAFTLQGVVDTRVKASFQATPWALLSVGANIPTGNATHTGAEAVVSSVLAMDLLGFREATFGTGLQITSSVATAMRAGAFGIGMAAAYAVNGEFEPSSELDLRYQPGNEARVRIGIDRNIGTSTFTAGATFMTYAQDQADGTNLFQAGNRMRFDASYAFRAGSGVWTLYATDLWREHGDLTLPFVDASNTVFGDTTIVTPSQNLIVAGLVGSMSIGSQTFRPQIDFKLQNRTESDGRDEGSGWLVGAGGDLPMRIFGSWDFFPKASVTFGAIKDPAGVSQGVMGAEFGGTLRWGF
jgi:hypothetical protein